MVSPMAYINLLDIIYPIGTIYLSSNAESPAEKFGGSWVERTSGEVLRAAHTWSSTGEDSHTLTVNQMPSHRHTTNAWVIYDKGVGYSPSPGKVIPAEGNNNSSVWNSDLVNTTFTGGGASLLQTTQVSQSILLGANCLIEELI